MEKNEEQFVVGLIRYLKPFFRVTEQVWSKCHTGRIDLVLKHGSETYFGVECKRDNSKKGEEIGEYVKQAIRYSKLEFEVETNFYKRIPIFICPPLSYKYFLLNDKSISIDHPENVRPGKNTWHQDRHEENNEHHTFNGFLGSFSIGEFRKFITHSQTYYGIMHSNKPVWSSERISKWDSGGRTLTEKIKGLDQRWYDGWIKKIGQL